MLYWFQKKLLFHHLNAEHLTEKQKVTQCFSVRLDPTRVSTHWTTQACMYVLCDKDMYNLYIGSSGCQYLCTVHHILNTVMHDHQTWYGIFHTCPIYLYVIYQQTSITVQYKMNLKCLFKDILYPTMCSLQNLILDGGIMYLTGTLVQCLTWPDQSLNPSPSTLRMELETWPIGHLKHVCNLW